MANIGENVEGIVVQNSEVQGYIRKNGAPVHSKPHGSGKMVLYYPKAPGEEAEIEKFEDHAGEKTPGTRDLIVQKPLMGSTEIGSTVARRSVRGGGAPPLMSPSALGNPNSSLADADIINSDALDAEITELEKKEAEADEERDDKNLSTAEKAARVPQEPVTDAPPPPSAKENKEEVAPGLSNDADEPFYKDDEKA